MGLTVNDGVPFKCPSKHAGMHNTWTLELTHVNVFQPLLMLLITPVLLLLPHVKISAVKKDYCTAQLHQVPH